MNLAGIIRLIGWFFFLGGACIIFFFVEGNPAKSTLGIVGFAVMITGLLCSIASSLIRIWPRKAAPADEDEEEKTA